MNIHFPPAWSKAKRAKLVAWIEAELAAPALAIEARQRQDAARLDPKGESAGPQGQRPGDIA